MKKQWESHRDTMAVPYYRLWIVYQSVHFHNGRSMWKIVHKYCFYWIIMYLALQCWFMEPNHRIRVNGNEIFKNDEAADKWKDRGEEWAYGSFTVCTIICTLSSSVEIASSSQFVMLLNDFLIMKLQLPFERHWFSHSLFICMCVSAIIPLSRPPVTFTFAVCIRCWISILCAFVHVWFHPTFIDICFVFFDGFLSLLLLMLRFDGMVQFLLKC